MGHSDNIKISDLKTIPNMLSVSRLILIPAMLIPAYYIEDEPQARFVFLIMFIIIGVTDKLDGTLARYLNQTSALGAKLDTIADMHMLHIRYQMLDSRRYTSRCYNPASSI